MTTRRTFLAGLMASAAAPALPAIAEPLQTVGVFTTVGRDYTAMLAASFRHTKEIIAANIMNQAWPPRG